MTKSRCLALFFFCCTAAFGQQQKDANPLIRFLQYNFDSSIVYHSWSSWYPHPNYRIIAKKENRVYFFTYKSPYVAVMERSFTGGLMEKFMQEQLLFEHALPDTNRYFLPATVDKVLTENSWATISACNIWNAKEDNSRGTCDVEDGETNSFFLIAKSGINVLHFYEPEFYLTCSPPSKKRQNAICTKKAFLALFQ